VATAQEEQYRARYQRGRRPVEKGGPWPHQVPELAGNQATEYDGQAGAGMHQP